ncbi:hypothetical protein F0562_024178 [Nyssa sinensis]|uniref:PGG domain-containing protein n=1 Tax=Nyssa sinensis TaxID=561372 RepID=A0A5J5BC13_9ASTE|nr:hypothetical protein F0562_024178 [Nyssa sinensis]
MERRLYEASVRGNVAALKALMEEDELILNRVSLTCFHETPLHVAALCGHVDFTRALLSRKPKLATELDSLGRSPLHFASAQGHAQIVRELLLVSTDVCQIRDQDGRTPLHLAAMNGRVDVIREFIRARPESTREPLDQGETVLHLCVKCNRFDTLKLLVEPVKEKDFLNSKDDNGNTIWHLAVSLKQMETIKYLFLVGGFIEHANNKNENGFTALDVLEHYPRDLKTMEIREFLLQAGVRRRAQGLRTSLQPQSQINVLTTTIPIIETRSRLLDRSETCNSKARQLLKEFGDRFFKIENEWLADARGNLLMAATLTATVAFGAGINPPGSVWQDNLNNSDANSGTSVFARTQAKSYAYFLSCNTVTFMASLIIILLMISGFPLKHRFSLWLLTMAMCTALAGMAFTYIISLILLTPDRYDASIKIVSISLCIWLAVCGIVLLLQAGRFLPWMMKKSIKFRQLVGKMSQPKYTNENPDDV